MVPNALNRLDVTLGKVHHALSMELVVLNLSVVSNTASPSDLVLAVHGLTFEYTFVDGGSFLITALGPSAIDKGTFIPAVTASL